ncbi:MAG: peptidylprolyl isomerase [Ferruginibacter sp.]|nr:peptidylprolyl isomerase [Ferruginibacter sp.]
MQIIQSIRDKGAAIVIIVISLSLIGFILMDSRQGGNSLFGSTSTNVGKVNGENIELAYFNKRVKQTEDLQEQRTGQRSSGTQTYQTREQMWNQIVAEKIFFAETEKLGIDFTSKELSAVLLSNDQNNPLLQEQGMKDPVTGKLDVTKAQTALSNIKKFKGEQLDAVNAQIVEPLKLTSIVSKYTGLLNAAVYYPGWMKDRDNTESKNFSQISFVNIPYSEISDSTVKVTDEEINEYVKKHKDLFKQEAGRIISYATFSQLPNQADSNRTKAMVSELIAPFAADSNAKVFVARNTSAIDFDDKFKPKSKYNIAVIDSIVSQGIGTVYGPFVDKGNIVISKMLGISQLPDSVKARHILIPVNDPQTGQPVNADSTAKKLADSIYNAILSGADFASLALKYSSDGSKDKGGDLGTYGYGAMVPEFNDFTFENPVGSKKVVQTQFGYHVIEIMNQKDFKPAYKIAFIAKEIMASDITINNASLEATKASAEKNKEALVKYLAKSGVHLTEVPTAVKENDFSVGALQDARQLVRWVFEAKKGDVSEPFSIGDQFIVATVEKELSEGVQDAATARPGAEAIIRNRKKAEIIIKKLGSNPTLESAAAAYNKTIQMAGADSTLTMSSQIINGLGVEAKVIGASFNKDYQTKVSPAIAGTSGVYLIKINGIQSKPADTPEVAAQQISSKVNTMRGSIGNWYEGLKKQASIKDNRSEFY